MLVTLAYCLRDQDITLKLFDWIAELGRCKPRHSLFLLRDPRCPENIVTAILERSKDIFQDVQDFKVQAEIDGWPEGANYMFRTATSRLQAWPVNPRPTYFMWLEPDAIPLKSDWLDLIEDEYLAAKRPFMGDRVEVENIPLHMSGVGVYQNPVYMLAGEAYRAADIAFDMAGKDQIVPNAHFTELIEHAWKHPSFTNIEELTTQIDQGTVLFHASKDGSLIDLLRQQRSLARAASTGLPQGVVHAADCPSSSGGVNPPPLPNFPVQVEIDETRAGPGKGLVPPLTGRGLQAADAASEEARDSISAQRRGEPIYDIFIRTYPADYFWLQYCLKSIRKYASRFRKVWIISPEQYPGELWDIQGTGTEIEWKVMNEESGDGYLSQQIHKLYADAITNYEPDYILHIDSDTLFTGPVTPEMFFTNGKLTWYYTPYEQTETPWKPITEKFMRVEVKNEFMRRLPMMLPRFLYDDLRKNCFTNHQMILSDYIRKQPYREFSEFNILGAMAWIHHHDKFDWIDTTKGEMPPPFARQFYSWSGITDEVKEEIQTILSGGLNAETTGAKVVGVETTHRSSPPPAQIISDDGYESPGDHVRWLADYCKGSPSRRQYVMNQLAKVNLKMMRRGRKHKQKEKIT